MGASLSSPGKYQLLLAALIGAPIAYFAGYVVYNLLFHPLRSFPGPISHRATQFPFLHSLARGRLPQHVADLHAHYGDVVRIAPNELSFTSPQAWRDIYSRQGGGRYEISPEPVYYELDNAHHSLPALPREQHDALRKMLRPGFSDGAMRVQEPRIGGYVDLLIKRLAENHMDEQGKPQAVNLRDWFAYTTFDVIGNLAFGSDFGCLRDSAYHPWVFLIIGAVKDMTVVYALCRLGLMGVFSAIMATFGVGNEQRALFNDLVNMKTKERIAMGTGCDDFLDGLVETASFEEISANSTLLIVAGSETTATLLSGVTFLLTSHPRVLEKLNAEVRERFTSEDEITLASVAGLTYMLAVLNEALRIYPPAIHMSPRQVGRGGASVAGHFVPEKVVVGIFQWAQFHDPKLFTDPDVFAPERWTKECKSSRYAEDRLDAVHPFLVGPRNCIGQSLAYAEMRLILARLVWNFNMRLGEDCEGWLRDQKSYYNAWSKPDLPVYLSPVER